MTASGAPLSANYRVDIKVTIKKFYKWLWGDNRTYPEIVNWVETLQPPATVNALSELEIERMVDRATTIQQRVFIQILFDGGLRLGELLNVRLMHVAMRQVDPVDPTKRCFFIRVPFSKSLARTVALPMQASTKWLLHWLEMHPSHPKLQADGSIAADNARTPLFSLSDTGARLLVRRAGRRALQ